MQCYTILYSRPGNFLTFVKNTTGYFFKSPSGTGGTVYPNGIPIQDGPGLFAFPGGEANAGEEFLQACLRTFVEDCGAQINFSFQNGVPQSAAALTTINFNNEPFNILYPVFDETNTGYCVLYIELADNDLMQIQDIILNTNLQQARQMTMDIRYHMINAYDSIFNMYSYLPANNEFGLCIMWNNVQNKADILALQNGPGTSAWYYDMITYMENTLL